MMFNKFVRKIAKILPFTAALSLSLGSFLPSKALAAPNLTVNYLSSSDSDQTWGDDTTAKAGEGVYFYLELHNTNVPSLAENVKIKVSGFNSTNVTNFVTTATYSADNAGTVTDNTNIFFDKAVNISYVPGSAKMTWDVDGDGDYEYNGSAVSDAIFGEGVVLGNQQGCNPFIIQISFEAKTEAYVPQENPKMTVLKQVSYGWERDNGRWYDSIAKETKKFGPGEYFYYHVIVENLGDVTIKNVVLEDQLPSYIRWTGGAGSYDSDHRIVTIKVGDVAPGAKLTYEYQVRVEDSLPNGDRTQENAVVSRAANYRELRDSTLVWIHGGEVEIVEIVKEEKEVIEKLPETGSNVLFPSLITALGCLMIGLGLRKLENN